MPKYEISICLYICRHLSLPFYCFHAKRPLHIHTHATSCSNALLLSSSIIPPLFLSSSSRYHYITVFLCCSATCLASPSLICPTCLYFIPLCLFLSLLLTQKSFSFSRHPSLRQANTPLVYAALSTSRSPSVIISRFSAPYLTRKWKQICGGLLKLLKKKVCVRKSSSFCLCLHNSCPSILILFASIISRPSLLTLLVLQVPP